MHGGLHFEKEIIILSINRGQGQVQNALPNFINVTASRHGGYHMYHTCSWGFKM